VCTTVLRSSLGIMFIVAGIIKVHQPFEFLGNVYEWGLASVQLGALIAAELPWLEVIIGVCLLIGGLRRGSSLLACLLATSYVCINVSVLVRGVATERIVWGVFGARSVSIVSLGYASVLLVVGVMTTVMEHRLGIEAQDRDS